MMFLRRVPRDPFADDASTPDAQTWRTRSYGSPPGDFSGGVDVFDISSHSSKSALDGSKVADW
jgi:general secretion pathway protein G